MFHIIPATTDNHMQEIRKLFREYEKELNVDLCFQQFEAELNGLPGKYTPPDGALLMAIHGNSPAGCVAMRRLSNTVCEMKRLYTRPQYRHQGVGGMLSKKIISYASDVGYHTMYLDTLEKLEGALFLYRSLGFQDTEPYYHNPLEGVVYLQLDLYR